MKASILICTRNRAESLRATLAAIGRCAIPAETSVELLVVDNGSADHTADVARDSHLEGMPVRYLYAPDPGLSNARNAGVAGTNADIMIFTDDDVRPNKDWIERLVEPILAGRADAVSGRVAFPEDREVPWFTPLHRAWLANTDRLKSGATELVGANMAFRRGVLSSVEGFDQKLGAGALGFGEEKLFSLRLEKAGFRILYSEDAVVYHHFDMSRITRRYFLRMAERMGRSEAYLSYHWFGMIDSWCGSGRRRSFRRCVRETIEMVPILVRSLLGTAHVTEQELMTWTRRWFRLQYRVEQRKA